MSLLPGWKALLETQRHADDSLTRRLAPVPVDLPKASSSIRLVETPDAAAAFADELMSVRLTAVALDSEFTFARRGVELRFGKTWYDIRSQVPIAVSVAAWAEAEDGQGYLIRAVLDVRRPGVVPSLAAILSLPCPIVSHNVKAELFTFWSLGLDPHIRSLYDTHVVAACLNLGLHHRRGARAPLETEAEEIRREDALEKKHAHLLSLVGQCERYGLPYPFSESKDDLRGNFLGLRADDPLDPRMVEYAAADAEFTLRLYAAQQPDVLRQGIHHHLETIEYPFAVANARIEWDGVHVDPGRLGQLRDGAGRAGEHYAGILKSLGVARPGSRQAFLGLMEKLGLEKHLLKNGEPSTEDDILEAAEALHPAIRAFRLHRRYRRLAGEEWLTGALIGADGRLHPQHRQLGAATGRNTCTTPNIVGIGRVLRPVVTAPPGRAIFEADFAQIEVGVAAALHGDPDLIQAYNTGDVYAAMAQRFYAGGLTDEERCLPPEEFRRRRPELRDAIKTLVLAIIYNIQAPAIAARFGMARHEAEAQRERFLNLYPTLKRGLEDSSVFGALRGYASTSTGLRRHVERRGGPDGWTRNFLRNTPIQGSAADVFKLAVVRIYEETRGTEVRIVLPVHDAVVMECPADDLDETARRVAEIMRQAAHSVFPALIGKVSVNKSHPSCWNKDGHADSLDRFLADPDFTLDATAIPGPPVSPHVPGDLSDPAAIGDRPAKQEDARLNDPTTAITAEIEDPTAGMAPPEVMDWPYAPQDDVEERAAILEYDAGLTREEAERRAREMVLEAHRLDAPTTVPRPGDQLDAAPAARVRDDALWDRILDEMDGWPAARRSATFARAEHLSRGGLSHDDAFLRAFAEVRGDTVTFAPGVPHGPKQAEEGAP